jgi:hypothetical protein
MRAITPLTTVSRAPGVFTTAPGPAVVIAPAGAAASSPAATTSAATQPPIDFI